MFLNESYGYDSAVSADPMYGAQIIQEATESWNDLCMKMIKLEHTAIVQEDAELLQEGIKEFGKKVEERAKYVGQKFLQYLEQIRVQWSKIQASVMTKICNPTMVENLLAKVKDTKLGKISTNFSKEKLNYAEELISDYSKMGSELKAILNHLDNEVSDRASENKLYKIAMKMKDIPVSDTPIQVTRDDVTKAIKFLKQRPIAIKNIELMKKYVTVSMKEEISRASNSNSKFKKKSGLVQIQRYCNSIILAINAGTSTAIKVCNAVKQKSVSTKEQYKAAKKFTREGRGNYVKTANVIHNESVLDMFD